MLHITLHHIHTLCFINGVFFLFHNGYILNFSVKIISFRILKYISKAMFLIKDENTEKEKRGDDKIKMFMHYIDIGRKSFSTIYKKVFPYKFAL